MPDDFDRTKAGGVFGVLIVLELKAQGE